MPSLLGDVYQKLSVDEQARFASLIAPVLTGLIAALLQIVSVLSLLVGRYWQALLYNPGGFGREFRAIRFPLGLAMLLLAFMLLGPNFGSQLAMLTPLCSVPLVFAGLALIHGLVAQKRLARFWLVGLYVTLLLFMQLIYLEKVTNLGNLGDKVNVKAGYGRNYLLPYGKATAATAANVAAFEERRAELEKLAADKKASAETRAAQLAELEVTITATAGDEGKLFGSIGTHDIADALTASGVEVAKSEVRLPNGTIRNVGEFDVAVHLHSDVEATVRVVVVAA